jgi:hypothetical protein
LSSSPPPNQEAADDLEFMEELLQEHMVVQLSLKSVLKQEQPAKKMQQPSLHGPVLSFPSKSSMRFDAFGKKSAARRKALEEGASSSGKDGAAGADVNDISNDEEGV